MDTHTCTNTDMYIDIKNTNPLDVLQSIYFSSKLPSSECTNKAYYYVPDNGSLLPKYRDCTKPTGFALYLLLWSDVYLLYILCIYIYINCMNYIHMSMSVSAYK